MKTKEERTIPAENFMATIAANVDNENIDDKTFREFIRNTLPIVIYKKQKTKQTGGKCYA